MKFLETQENILWWHKQSDSGKENFAIEYFDSQEQKERLFYPDFLIMTKENRYFIVDSKKGDTAKSIETKDKAEALQKWIKEHQNNYDFEIFGGIVMFEHPSWKINQREEYDYSNINIWEKMEF